MIKSIVLSDSEGELCHFMSVCVFSVVSNSALPRTVAHQSPLSVAFPRQNCLSGLPFPAPSLDYIGHIYFHVHSDDISYEYISIVFFFSVFCQVLPSCMPRYIL